MSRWFQRPHYHRLSLKTVLSAAFLAAMFLAAGPSFAQDRDTPDAAATPSKFLEIRGSAKSPDERNARDIWKSTEELSEARLGRFEEFFFKKYLPQMTQAYMREDLPSFRDDLRREFLDRDPGNPKTIDQLNDILFRFMYGVARGARRARLNSGKFADVFWIESDLYSMDGTKITDQVQALLPAKKDFHPAVRYNAMLILGDLNTKKAKIVQRPQKEPEIAVPADPYLQAFTPMLDVAIGKEYRPSISKFAQTETGPAPEAVRIAALLGLKRHLDAKPTENAGLKDIVIGEMIKLANRQVEGAGADWRRRLAVEILGTLPYEGTDGKAIVSDLDLILNNAEYPISVRCAAAKAIGNLQVDTAPSKESATKLTQNLRRLAIEACLEQVARGESPVQEMSAAELIASLNDILIGLRGYGDLKPADDEDAEEAEEPEIGGVQAWIGESDQNDFRSAVRLVLTLIVEADKLDVAVVSDDAMARFVRNIARIDRGNPRK